MKKITFLFVLFAMFVLQSCNNDFKVGADYKDYTVVFGLLARTDTAHYIKVTKGFYSETENNLLLAQIPDSIYYNNIEVKLLETNNGATIKTFILDKVDLNKEGYGKDSGVFAQTPNYAYKLKTILDATKIYKVVIKNIATGKEVYGETDIINNAQMTITSPKAGNDEKLNFAEVNKSFTNFLWKSPTNVALYDLGLKFWYEDEDLNTGIRTHKSAMIPLQKNIANSGTSMIVSVKADEFYRALLGGIPVAGNNIVRYIDTPDVYVSAGGTALKTYIDVTSAQGGITYDQIKPYYTNMKGEDVLGLFSTRSIIYSAQVQFDANTILSMINGANAKSLKFVGVSAK